MHKELHKIFRWEHFYPYKEFDAGNTPNARRINIAHLPCVILCLTFVRPPVQQNIEWRNSERLVFSGIFLLEPESNFSIMFIKLLVYVGILNF